MVTVAFIMSASHSGSTLLAMLLGSQQGATTIGDTAGTGHRDAPDYRCSCGALACQCPFWADVVRDMAARGVAFDITDFGTRTVVDHGWFINRVLRVEHRGRCLEAMRDLVLSGSRRWRARFDLIAQRYVALAESASAQRRSRVFVDSSKQPHRLKFLLRIPELRFRVVHLVRDVRGVVDTYLKTNRWTVERSATEWRRSLQAAECLLAGLKDEQWCQVHYEALCADPGGELARLCRFLDLDAEKVNLSFRSAGLHVFGNSMRLASSDEVVLDDDWRRTLDDDALRTFDRVAGAMNRKYGYE